MPEEKRANINGAWTPLMLASGFWPLTSAFP
jgi:hypothetical protein